MDSVLAEKLLGQATFSAVHPLFSISMVLSDIHDDAGFLDTILSVILKAFFTFFRCLAAFVKTGDEYQILKEKFNIILQVMFSGGFPFSWKK